MKRVLLWLAAAVACTKEAGPSIDAQPPSRAKLPPAHASRPMHRLGPVTTTPRELFEDFTRPDADGIALVDKYAGGVAFTATIKTVGFDEDGAPIVWIDIDGENVMSLDFADRPGGLVPGASWR
jgi:hypothetical protein